MADQHGFSDPDWELLVGVPLAVFLVVAYADGSLSTAERRTFASIASEVAARAERPEDALVRAVMGQICEDFDQITDHLDLQMAAGLPWVLAAGRSLLDEMPDASQAQAFKEAMIHMAQMVAEAWPRFGRRTTPEEQHSIDYVRERLGVALPGEA
jgi:uncharacterized membrane protein YccC